MGFKREVAKEIAQLRTDVKELRENQECLFDRVRALDGKSIPMKWSDAQYRWSNGGIEDA